MSVIIENYVTQSFKFSFQTAMGNESFSNPQQKYVLPLYAFQIFSQNKHTP